MSTSSSFRKPLMGCALRSPRRTGATRGGSTSARDGGAISSRDASD
jgi:hypothetical protein